MENFLITFNAIAPIFILLSIGYILRLTKVLDDHAVSKMNDACFKVFFSLLLFNAIYNTDIAGAFSPKMLLAALCTIFILYIFLFAFIPVIEKDNAKRGVLIQGIFRSNFVIFGVPITTAICGTESLGAVSVLVAVVVPVYNLLSVFALEFYNGEKINWGKILKSIATNPFIIGALAAILFLVSGIKLPEMVADVVGDLAAIATPLGLILLGATFKFSALRKNIKGILLGVIGKLVAVPLVCITIFVLLGFRGTELTTLTVLIGAPTAVSSYTMADRMGGDAELAGELVVIGSITSIFTMFLWLFALMQMGLIG